MVSVAGKGGGPWRTKTARDFKRGIIEVFNAAGGKNKLIEMCKKDDKVFIEVMKTCAKWVPKEIEITGDTNITISMQLPRPETEKLTDNSKEINNISYSLNPVTKEIADAINEEDEEEDDE